MPHSVTNILQKTTSVLCCCALFNRQAVPARHDTACGVTPVLACREPHHHVVFENDLARVFRVLIPADACTLWHRHEYDFVVAGIAGTTLENETLGKAEAVAGELITGSLQFSDYANNPTAHRIHNTSAKLNHQLAMEILTPTPGQFPASERSGAPPYALEIDNSRIHAFRLKLKPGEIAPRVHRSAPALRIILSGDRIIETDAHEFGRQTNIQQGDFFWLGEPTSTSITNAADAPLELLEIEIK